MSFSPWAGADFTRQQYQALTAAGEISGATYDGSNRLTAITVDGVSYTISYSSTEITITGSDGSRKRVGLDVSGRIVSSTTELV